MIRIYRYPCPSVLLNTPRSESCYNNNSVTSVLNQMQFEKCAYCEKNMRDGAQVDHYIPLEEFVTGLDANGEKQYNWNEANRWENLVYSCIKCNGAKKTNAPFKGATRLIIDPTTRSNPENYLDFKVLGKGTKDIRVTIIPKANSSLGKNTIDKLKLDIRKDHIDPLNLLAIEFESLFLTLLVKINQGQDINHQDCQNKITSILTYMLSNSPYSGFSRAFFRQRLEEFEQKEKPSIERALGHNVNLTITIPTGVVI